MRSKLLYLFLVGCGGVAAMEAEATYLGQQTKCVNDYRPNKAAIDACRDAVKARWDAGADK